MKALIDKMIPGDMPDFDPALEMAYKALMDKKKDFGARHIIIISDGDPMQQDKKLLAKAIEYRVWAETQQAEQQRMQKQGIRSLYDKIAQSAGEVAQAKGMDGWLWSASFAPDGNLLAWGQNVHETDRGQFTWDGLGLRLIDPTTGAILQQGLDGLSVDQVLPTPDGRAIIATATRQQGPEALYRLDPHTLAVQASRQFSGNVYPQPLILARP